MAGSFFLPPTHSALRPAPLARKSHNHRARETGTTGAGPALVRSMPDGWHLGLAHGWSAGGGSPLAGQRGRV